MDVETKVFNEKIKATFFSLMDNCFYDEEIEKAMIEKNRDKIKNFLKY
ncbi:hypothetical protein MHL86_01610 [Brevibacillus laterosporus]|nr:hypothetical protein [Brevibacillus laterosporus]